MYCIAILVIIIIAICLCCVTKSNFKPKSIYTGNIPKVIIQTGADMESLKKGSDKWRTIHPDFEYVYFDNNGCKDFIRKYLGERTLRAFNKLKAGPFKADLFRYCYLYINGGVYIDLCMSPIINLNDILLPNYDIISVLDRWNTGIYQAFLASVPKVELFMELINRIIYHTENEIYQGKELLGITGPRLWYILSNRYKAGHNNVKGYNMYLYIHRKEGGYVDDLNKKPIINNKGANYRTYDNNSYHTMKTLYNADILFTTWYDQGIAKYADITAEINKRYCDRIGYDFVVDHKRRVPNIKQTWERFPLIIDMIGKVPHKYICWIDADACFNPKSKYVIEDIINRNKDKDFIFSDDVGKNHTINAGIFILKNNEYCKNMLNYFLQFSSSNHPDKDKYAGFDQAAINIYYLENINNLKDRSVMIDYGVLQIFPNLANDKNIDAIFLHTAGTDSNYRVKYFNKIRKSL